MQEKQKKHKIMLRYLMYLSAHENNNLNETK